MKNLTEKFSGSWLALGFMPFRHALSATTSYIAFVHPWAMTQNPFFSTISWETSSLRLRGIKLTGEGIQTHGSVTDGYKVLGERPRRGLVVFDPVIRRICQIGPERLALGLMLL